MVQWLRLCSASAGGAGSIPGWGTRIPHALRFGQKKKKKKIWMIAQGNPRWAPNHSYYCRDSPEQ